MTEKTKGTRFVEGSLLPCETCERLCCVCFAGYVPTAEERAASDLRAAKERLGAWLAGQTWRSFSLHTAPAGAVRCELHQYLDMLDNFQESHEADGPTEDAASLAALEKVNA